MKEKVSESHVISVRLDKADYDKLREVADFLKMPVSKFARLCLHTGLVMAEPSEFELPDELKLAIEDALSKFGKKE